MSQPQSSSTSTTTRTTTNSNTNTNSNSNTNTSTSSSNNYSNHPNQLFDRILQPTKPPPKAPRTQLAIFQRIITRRTDQLLELDLKSHKSLHRLLFDEHKSKQTSKELKELYRELPSKKPVEERDYVSVVRYLLVCHFHVSIDIDVIPDERQESLDCLSEILQSLDVVYAAFVAEELKKKKKREEEEEKAKKAERERKEREKKAAEEKEAEENEEERRRKELELAKAINSPPSALPPSTDNSTDNPIFDMGLKSSKPSSGSASDVIEILEDSPPNSPVRPQNGTASATTTTSAAAAAATANGVAGSHSQSINANLNDHMNATMDGTPNSTNNSLDQGNYGKKQLAFALQRARNAALAGASLATTKTVAAAALASAITPSNQTITTNTPTAQATGTPLNTPKLPIPTPIKTHATPTTKQHPRATIPNTFLKTPVQATLHLASDSIPNQNSTYSNSLASRSSCRVIIHEGAAASPHATTSLPGPQIDRMYERFETWDPYWKLIYDVGMTRHDNLPKDNSVTPTAAYETGLKTVKVFQCSTMVKGDAPLSALRKNCQIPNWIVNNTNSSNNRNNVKFKQMDWGKIRGNPGKISYSHGERRLLVRSLPEKINLKKRSDTHQWPKGTFVQVNSVPVILSQRKQQTHDPKLWKGMCHPFDMTQYVKNPNNITSLQISTNDEDTYHFQVGICEYISPPKLYELCMSKDENVPQRIRYMSKEESLDVAKKHMDKSAVVLDESDDEGNGESLADTVCLTLSLLCKMSMVAMQTPVRGRNCKHIQCFDLQNYLHTNATISGGRWRCGVCEDFVPLKDLVVDGLMVDILKENEGQISGVRDKIQLRKNGTYKLMEENKLRYSKKRPSTEQTDQMDGKKFKREISGSTMKRPVIQEIIDLD